MAQIAEGAGIGKVLQDRQALMGFLAYRNQHDQYGQNGTSTKAIFNTGDSVGDNQALITETPAFKAERLAAERTLAMQAALDKVNPLLGGMAEGASNLMRDFPVLSAAIEGSVLGVTALGAAALASSGILALMGGAGANRCRNGDRCSQCCGYRRCTNYCCNCGGWCCWRWCRSRGECRN